MSLETFLEQCWRAYCAITPDAGRIHQVLSSRGDLVINDHVAIRTFNLPGMTRQQIGRVFEGWGYSPQDDMDFPQKKLKATYWLHPDRTLPKIFISELLLENVSEPLRAWIRTIVPPIRHVFSPSMLLEPLWPVPVFADYQRFYDESEYAAWTAAFGVRVNHFTVLVNSLRTFSSLGALCDFLVGEGFVLNAAGGMIKGSPGERLEQASTQAQRIDWKFAGGEQRQVMSCYYEFARRYAQNPMSGSDELFQGFIPKSADKIFESTFERKR